MSAPASEPKRRTAPPLETIIDAAAQLFGTKGYANTSMQDVADLLGIAKPTLYVHAKSKLRLLEGVYDQVLTDGEQALDAAEQIADPFARLGTFIRLWTEATIRRRSLVHAFFAGEAELPDHLAAHYDAWSAKTMHRVRDIIVHGQNLGAYRSDLDATTVAFAIVSATQWTARWWHPDGSQSLDDVIRTHTTLVEDGLRPRP